MLHRDETLQLWLGMEFEIVPVDAICKLLCLVMTFEVVLLNNYEMVLRFV